jgi:hypothetical protein
MNLMHFQEEDVATHICRILSKDKHKLQLRHKVDVSGKLRTEIRHSAQENRLKVNDMQCSLVYIKLF